MATATHLCSSPLLSLSSITTHNSLPLTHRSHPFLQTTRNRICTKTFAMGSSDLLGDFGARDPFPAEVESRFADKVLGNGDTEHKILIPKVSSMSLAQQDCLPVSPFQPPMSQDEAQKMLKKVVGWRLINGEGGFRLQCLWKLRDFKAGVELINRIYKVVEPTEHFPNIYLEQPNQVRAALWTASIGGLSINDFIVAAKIDEVKASDLVCKKRIWA